MLLHWIMYFLVVVIQFQCFEADNKEENMSKTRHENIKYMIPTGNWMIRGRESKALPIEMSVNCSQVFHITHDELIQFFIPEDYPANLYCIIMLRGPVMNKLVLTLTNTTPDGNISLNTTDCSADAVHVYSVSRGLVKYKDQLCNSNTPAVVTDANIGLLTFNSAGSLVSNGFTVQVQILPRINANDKYHHLKSPYDCETQSWIVGYHYSPKWTSQNTDLITWLKADHNPTWSQTVPLVNTKWENLQEIQTYWEKAPKDHENWQQSPDSNSRWQYIHNTNQWDNRHHHIENKWYKPYEIEGKWYK